MAPVPLSQQPRGGLGAGVRTEPYPNVVLPVVSLLEFLRRVGKPLQNKWERRNEPRESKRSQTSPTAAQDRGCHPNSQHPILGFLQHPATPLLHWLGSGGDTVPAPGRVFQNREQCFLLAPAFPASQDLQRNCCHWNSTGLSHCSWAAVSIPPEQGTGKG